MNIFTKHPHKVGETYWQHFANAMAICGNMLLGSMACFIHAIFPFAFEKTASNILFKILKTYISRLKIAEDRVVDLYACIEIKINECKGK